MVIKRTVATKLQSWWRYSSEVVGAKQPWWPIFFTWSPESPKPSVVERCRLISVLLEEVFTTRCFGNWKGEKMSPEMPMLSAQMIWPS